MGKHFVGNEIKWYRPFALVKRVKELERLTQEQFSIINDYKDTLDEKNQILQRQLNIIASLHEDLETLKENLTVAPDEAVAEKPKRTRKTTTKKEVKKEPAKRGRKKKEEK